MYTQIKRNGENMESADKHRSSNEARMTPIGCLHVAVLDNQPNPEHQNTMPMRTIKQNPVAALITVACAIGLATYALDPARNAPIDIIAMCLFGLATSIGVVALTADQKA